MNIWRNLLLGAVSAALFFGGLELVLRLSRSVPTNTVRTPDLETLDSIPGLFEPGADFVDRILPALPYRVTINSLGFRGDEFPERPRPGSIRILCLGDSYTFGPYVDNEETFPANLDRLLEELLGTDVEVINGGANGFTIADEMLFLSTKAIALEPRAVILAFSQNDLTDLARPRPQYEVMREHADLKSKPILGPIIELLQHTAIFNGMQRVAARLRGGGPSAEPDEEELERLWRQYLSLLEDTASFARGADLELIVMAWPSAPQILEGEKSAINARLEKECERLELPFLDLAPVMTTLRDSGPSPYLLPHDSHPSAAAYRSAAERMAPLIVRVLEGAPGS